MNQNKTLIIDITQLIHWPGKLTGIPRVMNELVVRYLKEDDVVFIIWDPLTKKYFEVDAEQSLKDKGRKIHYKKPARGLAIFFIFFQRVMLKLKRKGIPLPSIAIDSVASYGVGSRKYNFSKGQTLLILWGEQNNMYFALTVENLIQKGVKVIQIVYDLLPVVTPQYSGHSTKGMSSYNMSVVSKSDLVLSISEYTKKDLREWLTAHNQTIPRIEVFRLGDDFSLSKKSSNILSRKDLQKNEYILTVGTIEARKNHMLLYYVYKIAASKNIELPKIAVVGRQGWLGDAAYSLMKNDPLIKDKYVVIEDASDEELAWIYSNALLTVYPSFYEGWGLPIAESIAYGTPVLCSNTSSMPEVAGDRVTYFNPYSPEECLGAILNALKPEAMSAAKKKIAGYKPTKWDQTFEQFNSFVKEVT